MVSRKKIFLKLLHFTLTCYSVNIVSLDSYVLLMFIIIYGGCFLIHRSYHCRGVPAAKSSWINSTNSDLPFTTRMKYELCTCWAQFYYVQNKKSNESGFIAFNKNVTKVVTVGRILVNATTSRSHLICSKFVGRSRRYDALTLPGGFIFAKSLFCLNEVLIADIRISQHPSPQNIIKGFFFH